jgi:hypothetical protein
MSGEQRYEKGKGNNKCCSNHLLGGFSMSIWGQFIEWLGLVITMLVMSPFNHYIIRHDNHGVILVF